MNADKLLKAIGNIDDEFINEAKNYEGKRKYYGIGMILTFAVAVLLMLPMITQPKYEYATEGGSTMNSIVTEDIMLISNTITGTIQEINDGILTVETMDGTLELHFDLPIEIVIGSKVEITYEVIDEENTILSIEEITDEEN